MGSIYWFSFNKRSTFVLRPQRGSISKQKLGASALGAVLLGHHSRSTPECARSCGKTSHSNGVSWVSAHISDVDGFRSIHSHPGCPAVRNGGTADSVVLTASLSNKHLHHGSPTCHAETLVPHRAIFLCSDWREKKMLVVEL